MRHPGPFYPPIVMLLFAFFAISVATPASSQDPLDIHQPIEIDAQLPLLLEVFVNGRTTGLIAAFTLDTATETLSATRGELIEVGVKPPGFAGPIIKLDDIDGLTYAYDAAAQTVALEVAADIQQVAVISAHRATPAVPQDPTWGAVLNYDTSYGVSLSDIEDPSPQRLTLATEAWIFTPFGNLSNTATFGIDTRGETDTTRLETTFQRDIPGKAVTLAIGDITTSSLSWSRPIRAGGIQLRRNFALRSDLVTAPLLSFGGSATVPTTVDVFIDNNRVFGADLTEGPFRVEDVPIPHDPREAVVILRGQNGVATRRAVSFFAAQNILKNSIFDYAVEVGIPREAFGLQSGSYSDIRFYAGSARYGLTDRLTAALHFEFNDSVALIGGGFNTVVADQAEVGLAMGHSRSGGKTAGFVSGSFRTQFGDVALQGSMLRADDDFMDLAQVTATGLSDLQAGSLLDFPSLQDVISIGFPFDEGDSSLGIAYLRSQRGAVEDKIATVSLSRSLDWRDARVNLRASYDFATKESRLSGTLAFAYEDISVQAGIDHTRQDGSGFSLSLFKALGDAPGSRGYRTRFDYRGRQAALAAAVATRTAYGVGDVAVSGPVHNPFLRGRFQGAIATVGRRVAAGGPINDAFAIVDVGTPNVPIQLQNRRVAVSGPAGRALITGLSSLNQNRISVNPLDVPQDTTLRSTATTVTPARRSGVLIDFGSVQTDETAHLFLVDGQGAPLPVGATAILNGRRSDPFVVGYDGSVFLTGVEAQNTLVVEIGQGRCAVADLRLATAAEPAQIPCH